MSTENKHIINGLSKLINSSLIKDVYPMLDKIRIVNLDLENGELFLDFQLNNDISYNDMYDRDFDPHYLIDYHIEKLLPFLGVKIPYISFDVYDKDNRYIFGYEEKKDRKIKPTYYKPNEKGIKTKDERTKG